MSVINKTFEIDLDLKQALTNYEWRVVEGDTGNVLVITLTDGGTAVDLTGARIIMMFSRGTSIAMQTNVSPDTSISVGGSGNNVVTVHLRSGSFAPGFVESYLQISTKSDPLGDEYDVIVTTAKFNFRCDRALFSDEYIMSLDSYSILNELIDEVQAIITGRVQADWNNADPTSPQYIANKPATYAPSSHTHGKISNDGRTSTTYTHEAGDWLMVADYSDSGRVMRTDITFGYATNKWLRNDGSWTAPTYTDVGAMASDATPTPAAHKSTHASGGTDELSPSDIGAVASSTVGAASGIATLDGNTKVTAAQASASIVNVTSSKTLALTDAGTFQKVNSSSAVTVTIPTNASVAFPTGTEIELCRYGSGSVTVAAASGVTIYSVGSYKSIADRYGCACLKKLDTNVWLLAGDI